MPMGMMGEDVVLVQLEGRILGPFRVNQLSQLRGFTTQTLVSFHGSGKWAPAYRALNLNFSGTPQMIMPRANDLEVAWTVPPRRVYQPDAPARSFKVLTVPPSRPTRGWVDRWFPRIAIFNLLLVIAGYSAWSYLPMRQSLEREFQQVASQHTNQLRPIISRLHLHGRLRIRIPDALSELMNKLPKPSKLLHQFI